METTRNQPPRRITDGLTATCSTCSAAIYSELLIADLRPDGDYAHRREVSGSFRQRTDTNGQPTGPVIPFCPHCTQE